MVTPDRGFLILQYVCPLSGGLSSILDVIILDNMITIRHADQRKFWPDCSTSE